jgi:GTP-binding protein
MNVNNVFLEAVGVELKQYPADDLPEIAFVGRSNVGKSSLINKMINRKALARTSSAPGKTRTVNFYNVENMLRFVDLPGYGYARAPKSESAKWGKIIESYLGKRQQLRAVALLVDSRHEPSGNDLLMIEWLRHYGHQIIITATKTDKLSKNELSKHTAAIRKSLALADGDVLIPFTVKGDGGREALWGHIKNIIEI